MISAAPTLLTDKHDLTNFSCNQPSLDEWLRKRALTNQNNGASRTYVITENARVVGYYALAAGSVSASEVPGKIKRGMPNPIPVMVLGRLAVDSAWQGHGLGTDLLRDAVLRTMQAARIGGIRALLVHAIDDRTANFYLRSGFLTSAVRSLTLFLPLHPLPE
jgi:GNAT superfamily N-acetyltransferase